MAETARKRFDINEKSSTNRRVGKANLHKDCAKRALNIVGIDKQNTGLIHVTNLFPYSPISLFPLPKWQSAQNPCPIRLSAGGGGAKSAPLNSFRRTKSALTHWTNAKEQRLLFRHTATNIFANCQNRHLAVSQIKFNTS